jgi:hypothetical protein
MSPTLFSATSPSRMDAAAHNLPILPTTASASITPLSARVLHYSAELLSHLEPLMRKCVSEIDLYNALSALSREVAARRMGRKRAASLAYLSHALFQSDQMITEKELRTGAGPQWDRIRALLDDRTIDISPVETTPHDPSRYPNTHARSR